MKHYQSIKENIVGLNAFVYHRTRSVSVVKDILNTGFKVGSGDMYGKGLYTTYELSSQVTRSMEANYGNVIVKMKVNLYGFLILDYDQAKIVYRNDYLIADQLKLLNISMTSAIENIVSKIDAVNEKGYNTSSSALKLIKIPDIKKRINGLVFTGQHDGKVCVVYNPKTIIPVSYTITTNGNMVATDKRTKAVVEYDFKDYEDSKGQDPEAENIFFSYILDTYDPNLWVRVSSFEQVQKSIDAMNSNFYKTVKSTSIPTFAYLLLPMEKTISLIRRDYLEIPSAEDPLYFTNVSEPHGSYCNVKFNFKKLAKDYTVHYDDEEGYFEGVGFMLSDDGNTKDIIANISEYIESIDLLLPKVTKVNFEKVEVKNLEDFKQVMLRVVNTYIHANDRVSMDYIESEFKKLGVYSSR